MVILSVTYPATVGSHFDFDYYLATHVPMVKTRLRDEGLQRIDLMRGTTTPDGGAPAFEVMAQLRFDTLQQIGDGLRKHGEEIIRDIAKFTNIQPLFQINEPLELTPASF